MAAGNKEVGKGITITWVNATGANKVVGQLVVLSTTRVGRCQVDIANGATGTVKICGEIEYDAPAGALVQGAAVYLDVAADVVTATVTGNNPAGWLTKGKATAAGKVWLLINGTTSPV